MIGSFRSKALARLFEGKPKGIEASLRRKVEHILFTLSMATEIEAMDLPGFQYRLTGDRTGTWAVRVNKNWRITFDLKTERHSM